ncbi:hypothetical protein DICPUDRAFT_51299 [Dictyostelium purpureum]|uniref:PRP1 splicing factor N-terminal domain-containing protein n=1 Tax=Dictyostelium purpureum TaxID=5786 RepID=F1A338_DICPU|nr:uncharacterized protein DICPUDRAFT_51299 [Dictyostelium purpureum]EGC29393.1 hypothetical protein DICPUDRAFT_51299 [Dictyostelium purpureum]|eukprot:XP_003294080.1 hypothetical protein DICPUDRAFT_51299 [Dictyostelium purpureum]
MANILQKDKRFFLYQEPPPGYIAGFGRGAVGFTTRLDIGSARNSDIPGFEDKKGGGGGGREDRNSGNDDDDDQSVYGGSKFDEFEGNASDKFYDSNKSYDQDDKEADEIWDAIDSKMDSRRKKRKDEKEKQRQQEQKSSRPIIQQQLSDLKQDLSTITDDQWSSLPDAGNISRSGTGKKRYDIYTPVPDSLLERAKAENETYSILPTGVDNSSGTTTTDLTQVGSARKTVLDLKLHQVSDSVSGKTCVDPKGYLTDLRSKRIASDTEIGDIKKARLLFKSATTSNPKHAPGWIAAAKLEVLAGKMADARRMIAQACKECPENEEVWIENANLQTPDNAKIVLAQAVSIIPHSVKIWLYAANLEKQLKMKKRVLRRALEFIPTSVKLWKEAVELEEPEDARILLGRAVECVPDNVDLWLALANLETYEKAREVLNKARQAIPSSPEIWISAAQLEESKGKNDNVNKIIKKAIKSLSSNIMVMNREKWIEEAEKSEKNQYYATCQAIIFETIGMGIEEEERKRIWVLDAEECLSRGSIKTANAIYAHILYVFPNKKSVWLKVAQLEKAHGTKESLDQTLEKATKSCPQFENLWLMYAKEKWISGDVIKAREILAKAFQSNPGSENIWVAAAKIESEMNDLKAARTLLKKARVVADTERIWMKSALLERELGKDSESEGTLIQDALVKYPSSFKLWLMKAQLEERLKKDIETIRQTYKNATVKCPKNSSVWIEASRFEARNQNFNRARALLEQAKLKNPTDEDIILELVRFEASLDNKKQALTILSAGLQLCPKSGKLWAELIAMEPRHSQKNKCVDALNRCNNDPYVFTQVSKIFWFDSKLDKAKQWFQRVTTTFPSFGDGWAYYYTFVLKTSQNSDAEAKEILNKCIEAEPNLGEQWIKVSKQIYNSHLKTEQILKQVSLNISKSILIQQHQQLKK